MNLKPIENTKLFGMNIFFDKIINLYNQKKMPTKILLTGKEGQGKSTLAYHIINYILSENEEFNYNTKNNRINENNRSFKLLQNNLHPNFHLINLKDEKKNIDINQIREMIYFTNKSTFNNFSKLILIDNVEYLNKNSVNALLKVIEEPNTDIFFILIQNSEKYILPTLRSRCIAFKINFTFDESMRITNNILEKNILDLVNLDLLNYYNTPGELISITNFSLENNIELKDCKINSLLNQLIDKKFYKKNKLIKKMLINFIELFFLKEYKKTNKKNYLLNFYCKFINKVKNSERYNLDDESLFLEFKSKLLNG